MPNSDTWPRAVATEPSVSNMNSAGSCDSVISVNSYFSEDSMEHLSAEERACLMYLEETIESLDVQEDSGLSNDEPDLANLGLKRDDLDILLESGLSSKKHSTDGGCSTSTDEVSLLYTVVQHKTETQTLDAHLVSPSTLNTSDAGVHISAEPVPSDTKAATPVPALHKELSPSTNENPSRVVVLSSKTSPEVDIALIPPPSDFMDEPVFSPQIDKIKPPATSTCGQKPTIDLEVLRRRISERSPATTPVSPPAVAPVSPLVTPPVTATVSPPAAAPVSPLVTPPVTATVSPPAAAPVSPLVTPLVSAPVSPSVTAPVSLPVTAPVVLMPVDKPPFGLSVAPATSLSSNQTSSLSVAVEPRSPPAVAPKPKKLPSNIILKSHKSTGSYESSMGHPVPITADRLLMDPQQVRMEALRKLGLLRSEESDSGPALTLKHPQTRRSWAASSSPISPPPPKVTSPSAPCTSPPAHTIVPPTTQTVVYQTSTGHVPSEPLPDIIPVPAAFSDPVEPSHDEVFDGDSEPVLSDQGNVPVLERQLTPPEGCGVKSATLERSGLGLSSYMESLENNKSLSELRNSRPRPASLGSGKDFSSAHGGVGHTSVKVPDSQSCVPTPSSSHHSNSPQKLPRSQGISVVICPRAQNDGSRREALKMLGLLRD